MDTPILGLPAPDSDPQPPLPDWRARERIRTDLETNLLVEAGAGSGKTTALVDRMVSLVATGAARAQEVAAVTFTRKAAAELRERFQGALERALSDETDPTVVARLRDGLEEIDQAFLGTIHAFCTHLLRERPIEAGLDPGFEEMLEAENARLRKQFWGTFVERMVSDQDPLLEELDRLGVAVHQLEGAYHQVAENLDVTFPVDEEDPPSEADVAALRDHLDGLLDRARDLLPDREPHDGWDDLQLRIRGLLFQRRVTGWAKPADLIRALLDLTSRKAWTVVQKRWDPGGGRCPPAKRLAEDFSEFVAQDGPARRFLDRWFAHRYPVVIRLVRRAAEEYRDHRLAIGRLSFQDLLILTARLLRDSPLARRQLGRRFRRLLVDEFQDTDPIQAEVVFLLASEPEGPDDTDPVWGRCTPRPGALFVVGDPKQSIYRFRRADIGIYNEVKRRFSAFGDLLTLQSNFRSTLDVAGLVNDVFGSGGVLPERATPQQAAFAPLLPQRPSTEHQGVFTYTLEAPRQEDLIDLDAACLAGWIRRRVDTGEREPGDFLILTRTKQGLATYARALEDHGLAVDVAGAGVGYQEVLEELMAVLRALLDPENELRVVRVLTGLFFGIDLETLIRHKLEDRWFSFLGLRKDPGSPVERALLQLRRWWEASRRQPADVLINDLVTELGLFPHAAAGDLGSLRTGALVYALDAVRTQAVAGDTSLLGALEALEGALEWEDAEAPLEPGRSDAVRVLNVHKAKGLEATVVILARPSGGGYRSCSMKVERDPERGAVGWLAIEEKEGEGFRSRTIPVAAPVEWRRKQSEEGAFEEAEETRLLYVAATRARDELVVARREGGRGASPWGLFEPWLEAHATDLELVPGRPPAEERLDAAAADLVAAGEAAEKDRRTRARSTYRFQSVTELAKGDGGSPPSPTPDAATASPARGTRRGGGSPATPRGFEWGSVVHRALALAAGDLDGQALESVCRAVLIQEERPLWPDGSPRELDELLQLVERVHASRLWQRARSAPESHTELAFATPRPGAAPKAADLVEGVIDLIFREDDGWVIADYKTDVGDDPEFADRARAYRRQVELYAECWSALTGEPVVERVLLYTAQDREERW